MTRWAGGGISTHAMGGPRELPGGRAIAVPPAPGTPRGLCAQRRPRPSRGSAARAVRGGELYARRYAYTTRFGRVGASHTYGAPWVSTSVLPLAPPPKPCARSPWKPRHPLSPGQLALSDYRLWLDAGTTSRASRKDWGDCPPILSELFCKRKAIDDRHNILISVPEQRIPEQPWAHPPPIICIARPGGRGPGEHACTLAREKGSVRGPTSGPTDCPPTYWRFKQPVLWACAHRRLPGGCPGAPRWDVATPLPNVATRQPSDVVGRPYTPSTLVVGHNIGPCASWSFRVNNRTRFIGYSAGRVKARTT